MAAIQIGNKFDVDVTVHRYTIFFTIVNAVHVLGGFSALHQEFKNCTHSIWYVPGLLAATAVLCVQFLSS
jgi:hypothetical protein